MSSGSLTNSDNADKLRKKKTTKYKKRGRLISDLKAKINKKMKKKKLVALIRTRQNFFHSFSSK
jgi:hypothetical protein